MFNRQCLRNKAEIEIWCFFKGELGFNEGFNVETTQYFDNFGR